MTPAPKRHPHNAPKIYSPQSVRASAPRVDVAAGVSHTQHARDAKQNVKTTADSSHALSFPLSRVLPVLQRGERRTASLARLTTSACFPVAGSGRVLCVLFCCWLKEEPCFGRVARAIVVRAREILLAGVCVGAFSRA